MTQTPVKKGLRCPICRKPAVSRFRPFCSARCAQLDLGRWLLGNYRIPGEEAPDAAPGRQDPDEEEP